MNSFWNMALWCAHKNICISVKGVVSVCSKRSWPSRAIQVACLLPIDTALFPQPKWTPAAFAINFVFIQLTWANQSFYSTDWNNVVVGAAFTCYHMRLPLNEHSAWYGTFWDVGKIYFTQFRNRNFKMRPTMGWSRARGGNEVIFRFWQLLREKV